MIAQFQLFFLQIVLGVSFMASWWRFLHF